MLQTTHELCSEEEVLCQIMWICLQKLTKSLYELNNDRTLGPLGKPEDKPIKLTNKNGDAVDEAIIPKMMNSRAPSTEQYLDMD